MKSVTDVLFTNDGKFIVSCSSDLSIKIWDTHNEFICIKTLHGNEQTVSSICMISDNLLVSTARDGCLKFWDISTGYCNKSIAAHNDWARKAVISKDGQYLATCGNDPTIFIWDLGSLSVAGELKGHDHVVDSLAFAPLGFDQKKHVLASSSRDKTIKLWNIKTFQCIQTLVNLSNIVWTYKLGARYLFLSPRNLFG